MLTMRQIGFGVAAEMRAPLSRTLRLSAGVLSALCVACVSSRPERDVERSDPSRPNGGGAAAASFRARACVADNYPIAFVSTRGSSVNGLELYVMNPAGEVRQVARGAPFLHPMWSPDGHTLAFRHMDGSERGRVSELELISLVGGDRVALTASEPRPLDHDTIAEPDGPSWSPDGREIAYAASDDAGGFRIWAISREGGAPRRLLPELEASHFSPTWHPHDSSLLAYVASIDGVSDVWLAHWDTPDDRRNLTQGRVLEPLAVRFSPDGRWLAFSALPLGARAASDSEIYGLQVETLELSRLTDNRVLDLHPAWSPDGLSLLVARGGEDADGSNLDSETLALWQVSASIAEPDRLVTDTGWMNCEADWYRGPCTDPASASQ
jgi:Tol biopolymer transport system component